MTGLELVCLALTVFYEARGEDTLGQVAVAQIAMQRLETGQYGENICDVVHYGGEVLYRCHFSWYCDGKSDEPDDEEAWMKALIVAVGVAEGSRHAPLQGVLHYHTTEVTPWWANDMEVVEVIGNHIFLR